MENNSTQRPFTPVCRTIDLNQYRRLSGLAWRRARGLESWRDLAEQATAELALASPFGW